MAWAFSAREAGDAASRARALALLAQVYPEGTAQVKASQARAAHPPEVGGEGVLIAGLLPGAPAGAAGLRPGDLLLRYAGEDIDSAEQLVGLVQSEAQGSRQVSITILRDGAVLLLNIPSGRMGAELLNLP